MPKTGQVLQLFDDQEAPIPTANALPRNQAEIIVGDVRQVLRAFPDDTFQCAVTSPPYWGLRDYGIEGQIGAEMSLDDYLRDIVGVFEEVRRVLRKDGVFWLNIGDSYTSGGRTWRGADAKNKGRGMSYRAPTPPGLKPKDLIGVPWRIAFALQAAGWYLRADNIWNKPNCQPESVKDRPTRSHEYVFLFSKSEKYFYDWQAVVEPATGVEQRAKNRRTVWNINTEAYREAHFAVFPKQLARVCIQAGSRPGDRVLDPFFGSGTTGVVCNELNRQCTGVELNPEYADLATQRLGKRR
jgi:site-specific DNA-methyltransferase (adenine-specific)/site-specific DNA-methyltransferase (cytosine-N4-specific)